MPIYRNILEENLNKINDKSLNYLDSWTDIKNKITYLYKSKLTVVLKNKSYTIYILCIRFKMIYIYTQTFIADVIFVLVKHAKWNERQTRDTTTQCQPIQ